MTGDGGFRQELGQRLAEACAPALDGIAKARYWDVDREHRYDVDGFSPRTRRAARLALAAILPPFMHTPRTVSRAAGRAAFLEVLAGGTMPGRSSPAVSAHEGYRLAVPLRSPRALSCELSVGLARGERWEESRQ